MSRSVVSVASLLIVSALSCSHAASTSAPAPAPTPAPAAGARGGAAGGQAAAAGQAGAAGARGGAPGAGGRGTPMTPEMRAARRDSIGKLRGEAVAQLLTTIAGKEDQPAGQVFKNVQLLKDVPAKQFLVMMDSTFGRALSSNCTSCHIATDWSDDSRAGKGRTRIMITMMNAINNEHLTKMPAGRGGTPKINCMTCHRGSGNPGNAILP